MPLTKKELKQIKTAISGMSINSSNTRVLEDLLEAYLEEEKEEFNNTSHHVNCHIKGCTGQCWDRFRED